MAGKYFKGEFRGKMLNLECDNTSDFYVCCFQRNRSPVPLLCIRTVLFLTCLGILLTSAIMTGLFTGAGYWLIYLTHWGLVLITVATGLAFAVSLKAYFGPIDGSLGLPWYVKMFWSTYNIAAAIAFLITVFYWSFLQDLGLDVEVEYAMNYTLDIFIHAINSVVMLLLIITSKHPSRMLHFYQPLVATLIYALFSYIYYAAGGTDPFGNVWIYPMLDWSQPGPTVIMMVVTGLLLIIMHVLIVLIALLRDYLTKRNIKTLSISNGA